MYIGGRDGCRPYSYDIDCGTPCSPYEFSRNEKRRTCVKECQRGYYKFAYEDDKHHGNASRIIIDNVVQQVLHIRYIHAQ